MTAAPTIVLDLDDVLANLREALYQTLHRATALDVRWQTWQHYDLTQHFKLDKAALEALLVQERTLQRCEPEPGAAAATAALRALGYRLVVVTARGWHADGRTLSMAWLDQHDIVYDALHAVPLGGDKLAALDGETALRLAVDDHPNNSRRYSAAGLPSLLVDRPWNQGVALPLVTRIRNLDDLVEHAARFADGV